MVTCSGCCVGCYPLVEEKKPCPFRYQDGKPDTRPYTAQTKGHCATVMNHCPHLPPGAEEEAQKKLTGKV